MSSVPFCINSTIARNTDVSRLRKTCNYLPPLTNYSITMLPRSFKPILEQFLELSILLAVNPSEYFDVLEREFKRSGLESKVAGRV